MRSCVCFYFLTAVELDVDISSMALTMVVPWSLPEDLQADSMETRAAVKKIFKDEVRRSWTVWTAEPLYFCLLLEWKLH